jgi:hypothetical protein
MSYGGLEQTAEELGFLVGAKIERVEVRPDCMGEDSLNLVLTTKDEVHDQHGNHSRTVEVQVWMDSEGNGPGFLALTQVGPPMPRSGAEARAQGRVPEYADYMKEELLMLGKSEEEAEADRQRILARFGS